jgi:hypothetical protein
MAKVKVFLIVLAVVLGAAGCAKHGSDIFSDTMNEFRR